MTQTSMKSNQLNPKLQETVENFWQENKFKQISDTLYDVKKQNTAQELVKSNIENTGKDVLQKVQQRNFKGVNQNINKIGNAEKQLKSIPGLISNKPVFERVINTIDKKIKKQIFQVAQSKMNPKQAKQIVKFETIIKECLNYPIHYIFALDDSGSMPGQKWLDLMTAFTNTINMLRQIPNAQTFIKVSILMQGSSCFVFQQNVIPSQVNLAIKARFGGNNFKDTFRKAHNIIYKYVGKSNIRYIFMTDGGSPYPQTQVNQIKALKFLYPGKIQYYGIQFQTSGQTMNQINQELDGKNTISYTVNQLTSAFAQTITKKR